jgi:hypothetical protein
VSLSHLPFQSYYDSSLSSELWDYFYPHDLHHLHSQPPPSSTDDSTILSPPPDASLILKHLQPHSSANIVISITDEKLWKWFQQYCLQDNSKRSLQASIELLLQTIKMYWFIQTLPQTHCSKLFGDTREGDTSGGVCGFGVGVLPRTGMISFPNMNSQSLYKDLLLPMLSSHFNGLPIPLSPSSSSPVPVPVSSATILPKFPVAVRKFHQLSVTIDYSIPLLLSYFQHLTTEQILKIEIESILLILPIDDSTTVLNKENSSTNLPTTIPHPLHTKNCILTGNPHKLIPIGVDRGQGQSEHQPQGLESVQHELSCCFTRCGGYKMYTVARFLIEYLPTAVPTRGAGAHESISATISSSWWIPQQPSIILAT